MIRFLLLALVLLPLTGMAQTRANDRFLQGPEKVGEVRRLAGTVIGVHPGLEQTCYVVLADQPNRPQSHHAESRRPPILPSRRGIRMSRPTYTTNSSVDWG